MHLGRIESSQCGQVVVLRDMGERWKETTLSWNGENGDGPFQIHERYAFQKNHISCCY